MCYKSIRLYAGAFIICYKEPGLMKSSTVGTYNDSQDNLDLFAKNHVWIIGLELIHK